MPLQTSGAISFANLQTQFGGSNPISLSEYYAGGSYVASGTQGSGGAIPSSGAIDMSDFYGAPTSSTLDTQTLTVGNADVIDEGIGLYLYNRGYEHASSNITGVTIGEFGSISDGTSNLYSGAQIYMLKAWSTNPGGGSPYLYFEVAGTRSNSGWTSMTVNGTTYNRASATYATTGTSTYWQWPLSSIDDLGTGVQVHTVTWG